MDIANNLDQCYMEMALKIAEKGIYCTKRMLKAGCIIVQSNRVISQGWQSGFWHDNALATALNNSTQTLDNITLYLTHEMNCNNKLWDKCLEKNAIQRVVISNMAIDTKYKGRLIEYLNMLGIEVHTGILEKEVNQINKGLIKRKSTNIPWLSAYYEMTLDGNLTEINNKPSRLHYHLSEIKAKFDAVLIQDEQCLNNSLICDEFISNHEGFIHPTLVIVSEEIDTALHWIKKSPKSSNIYFFCSDSKMLSINAVSDNITFFPIQKIHNKIDWLNIFNVLASKKINDIFVHINVDELFDLVKKDIIDDLHVYLSPSFSFCDDSRKLQHMCINPVDVNWWSLQGSFTNNDIE